MNDAAYRIASNPASYRPVMGNHFEVTVHDLDGMINWADPDKSLITESALTLKVANDTFQGPTLNQQAVSINKGNVTLEFPGRMDATQSTASFQVYVNKSAYDILYSWKMASGNHETGDVGAPSDYWKRVEVDVTTGNKGTLVGTWTLNNAWISSLQEITFSNADNSIKVANITLRYFKPTWRSYQV